MTATIFTDRTAFNTRVVATTGDQPHCPVRIRERSRPPEQITD